MTRPQIIRVGALLQLDLMNEVLEPWMGIAVPGPPYRNSNRNHNMKAKRNKKETKLHCLRMAESLVQIPTLPEVILSSLKNPSIVIYPNGRHSNRKNNSTWMPKKTCLQREAFTERPNTIEHLLNPLAQTSTSRSTELT